jgi:hypothetical protein
MIGEADQRTPTEGRPGDSLAAAAISLARRFASGATLWCVAPQWPAHGRHVAAEFVHPVIVGDAAIIGEIRAEPPGIVVLGHPTRRDPDRGDARGGPAAPDLPGRPAPTRLLRHERDRGGPVAAPRVEEYPCRCRGVPLR